MTDRKGRTVYTGRYITFERAQRYARAVLNDTPNGSACIHSRWDGYKESRDFAGFAL